MKEIAYVLVFILLMGCGKEKPEKYKESGNLTYPVEANQKTELKNIELDEKFPVDQSLVDDEFANNPFNFGDFPYSFLKNLNPDQIESIPVVNQFIDEQVDTIYTFHFGSSSIKVYKVLAAKAYDSPEKQFVVSAIVRDSVISMKDNIRVGMSKQAFFDKFEKLKGIDKNYNTFRIEVYEVDQWVDFQFVDDRLVQAVFEGYMD